MKSKELASTGEPMAKFIKRMKKENPDHPPFQPVEMIFPKWIDRDLIERFLAKHSLRKTNVETISKNGQGFQYKVFIELS